MRASCHVHFFGSCLILSAVANSMDAEMIEAIREVLVSTDTVAQYSYTLSASRTGLSERFTVLSDIRTIGCHSGLFRTRS